MKRFFTIISLSASLLLGVGCKERNSAVGNVGLMPLESTIKPDTQHLKRAENFGCMDADVRKYIQHIRAGYSTGEVNSIMVVKDGEIIQEWYDNCYGPDFRNICWSASKTFTATAVGFAVQDGLLSLDSKVVDIIDKDKLPLKISDTLASLTVYNLLRMSSGLKADPIGPLGSLEMKEPTKTVLNQGFIFAPGQSFKYNSFNTYLLSEMVTEVTGKLVSEYLSEKLFTPMGISNYHWDVSAEGYNMGGWGLYITTEALAKMGLFFLQKGKWNGTQLLDSKWIEQAMSAQILQKGVMGTDDWNVGYGYQMWVCTHDCARLDGAHGQFSIICPKKNAVIVVTQHCNKTQDALNAIWENFYDRF